MSHSAGHPHARYGRSSTSRRFVARPALGEYSRGRRDRAGTLGSGRSFAGMGFQEAGGR